jgi:hypothetical protein
MNTSQSIMNDQHRATNSEWYCIKARTCSDKGDQVAYSTIHELLNRIEALEATQHAHVDLSHLIDPERERMAQEFMQAAGFAPRSSEGELRAAAHPAKSNHPAKPDSSLLSRVAALIDNGTACGREPRQIAGVVIRAVAAWMREQRPWGVGFWASLLEQEAER